MTRSVSVVVPYGGGNIELLRVQILALLNQEYAFPIQIIVACNIEVFDAALLNLPEITDRTLLILDATRRVGPSCARNIGWRHASSDVVLFCDADDQVSANWVAAMVESLQTFPVVGGRLSYSKLNDPEHASWNFQTTVALPRKFRHLEFAPSSNLGVRRQVLEAIDGFDEELSCGEDIDFCWRAQYRDFSMGFSRGAVVEYRLRPGIRGLWRQSRNYGLSDAPLLRKHAEFGARRALTDSVREFAAIGLALAATVERPGRFRKAVVRAGMFVGRVEGSLRHHVWVV